MKNRMQPFNGFVLMLVLIIGLFSTVVPVVSAEGSAAEAGIETVICGDLDDNGSVDDGDVIYLLWYTLMPDRYPLVRDDEPEITMTYEQYISLSAAEQAAFRNTFDSTADFFVWYNAAKADYDAQKPGIDVGDGSLNLDDLMNNGSGN